MKCRNLRVRLFGLLVRFRVNNNNNLDLLTNYTKKVIDIIIEFLRTKFISVLI